MQAPRQTRQRTEREETETEEEEGEQGRTATPISVAMSEEGWEALLGVCRVGEGARLCSEYCSSRRLARPPLTRA